jgi:hypothetical protein
MPYRRSPRYLQRIAARKRAMQEGRARVRMASEMPPRWSPPDLRRRLIVEDYDTGEVKRTVFDLHATRRIDSYRVTIDGKPQPGRLGWSRILGLLRVAMPRKCSLRWVSG